MSAAIIGFGLGFFVALQLGPMSLFLIRSTLRSGWRVGAAIGAGIATVDGLYAGAGAGGAAPLLTIHPPRLALGLAGAIVLIWLGARTLYSAFRVRVGGETASEIAGPRRAFLTALGGTASNPSTIVSWAAIFAAASTAGTRAHDRFGNHPRGWRRDREPDLGHIARNRCRSCGSIDEPAFDSSNRRRCRRRVDWIWWRTRVHDIGSPGRNRTCAHGLGNRRSIH